MAKLIKVIENTKKGLFICFRYKKHVHLQKNINLLIVIMMKRKLFFAAVTFTVIGAAAFSCFAYPNVEPVEEENRW